MFRCTKVVVITMLIVLFLPGCWDQRNIQDTIYQTALGIDYKDGQYVVYTQSLDFSSVAKTEMGKPTQVIPIWVEKGTGETLNLAMNDLYKAAQFRLFYSQISAVVYSESILKTDLEDVFDPQNRYREVRYTPWVFSTNEPIERIFTIQSVFNISPLTSILHQPEDIYKQRSFIVPLRYSKFISSYREPGQTTLLPSLKITERYWEADGKTHPSLQIDGVYALHEGKYKGWFPDQDLAGMRWMQQETIRSPLAIHMNDTVAAVLSLEKPKVRLKALTSSGRTEFEARVSVTANIVEIRAEISEALLISKAEEQVAAEIKKSYEIGISKHVDLMHLEHHLYRKHNKEWRKQEAAGFELTADSLKSINVEVSIKHSGKYKLQKKASTP